MQIHPAATIMPMQESTLPELAESIRLNGLIDPIELLNGEVLDGRRRLSACNIAKVTPRFINVNPPDPIAYVWAKHVRRELTFEERAFAGARMVVMYEGIAKKKMSEGGGDKKSAEAKSGEAPVPHPILEEKRKPQTRDVVAKAVNVSGRSIENANSVVKTGAPELEKAVIEKRIPLAQAAKVAKEKPEEQRKIVAELPAKKEKKIKVPKFKPSAPFVPEPLGVKFGIQAVNALKSIPINDPQRWSGFGMVENFINNCRIKEKQK